MPKKRVKKQKRRITKAELMRRLNDRKAEMAFLEHAAVLSRDYATGRDIELKVSHGEIRRLNTDNQRLDELHSTRCVELSRTNDELRNMWRAHREQGDVLRAEERQKRQLEEKVARMQAIGAALGMVLLAEKDVGVDNLTAAIKDVLTHQGHQAVEHGTEIHAVVRASYTGHVDWLASQANSHDKQSGSRNPEETLLDLLEAAGLGHGVQGFRDSLSHRHGSVPPADSLLGDLLKMLRRDVTGQEGRHVDEGDPLELLSQAAMRAGFGRRGSTLPRDVASFLEGLD